MDLTNKVPKDGEVFALSDRGDTTRAEFIETSGAEGAHRKVAWRLYDRLGRGVVLTESEIVMLATLMKNYHEAEDAE